MDGGSIGVVVVVHASVLTLDPSSTSPLPRVETTGAVGSPTLRKQETRA